jgi:hypothetical protein
MPIRSRAPTFSAFHREPMLRAILVAPSFLVSEVIFATKLGCDPTFRSEVVLKPTRIHVQCRNTGPLWLRKIHHYLESACSMTIRAVASTTLTSAFESNFVRTTRSCSSVNARSLSHELDVLVCVEIKLHSPRKRSHCQSERGKFLARLKLSILRSRICVHGYESR